MALVGVVAISVTPVRMMMIGWDTCSRLDIAPLLFECHPAAGNPVMLEECTGREMGFAIAQTRQWLQQSADCKSPKFLFWGDKLERPEIEEAKDAEVQAAPTS